MSDYAIYDPSTGQRAPASTSPAAEPARSQAAYDWSPGNVQTDDPHGEPFVDAADLPDSKVDGPLSENIIRSLDDVDDDAGDCDPHDADYGDASDDYDDIDDLDGDATDGNVTDNIITDARGLLRGMGVIPGPLSRTRM
jgi:hypothetical protein